MSVKQRGPAEDRFSWDTHGTGSTLTITLRGDVDITISEEQFEQIEGELEGPEPTVVLDLGAVTFMDSTGLRFLLKIRELANARNKQLLLGPLTRSVVRVIDVSGLLGWFEYVDGPPPTRSG